MISASAESTTKKQTDLDAVSQQSSQQYLTTNSSSTVSYDRMSLEQRPSLPQTTFTSSDGNPTDYTDAREAQMSANPLVSPTNRIRTTQDLGSRQTTESYLASRLQSETDGSLVTSPYANPSGMGGTVQRTHVKGDFDSFNCLTWGDRDFEILLPPRHDLYSSIESVARVMEKELEKGRLPPTTGSGVPVPLNHGPPRPPKKFLANTPSELSLRWSTRRQAFYSEVETLTHKFDEEFYYLIPVFVATVEKTITEHSFLAKERFGEVGRQNSGRYSVYETSSVPSISLVEYVRYLARESCASPATFIGTLVLLDRFFSVERDCFLTDLNAFKLIAAAARVASKVVEIRVLNNKHFAVASRVTLQSMNDLETHFLDHLRFNVVVHKQQWDAYTQKILSGSSVTAAAKLRRRVSEASSASFNQSSHRCSSHEVQTLPEDREEDGTA